MLTQQLPNVKRSAQAETPRLIKWLLIAVVISMPYQRTIVFPSLRQGYIVDLVMLALIGSGWGVILWQRRPLRLPLLLPHMLIIVGSLLGSAAALNRGEALVTLINDLYVWVFFYTAINHIHHRRFIHTLIKIWVVVAVLESLIIIYAVTFTADQKPNVTRGESFSQQLQQIDTNTGLDQLPAEYKQAKHVLKRLERNTQIEGWFFVPGTGLGTFANGDFTANYLAASIFIALAMPIGRRRWVLRSGAIGLIFLACLLTGVSSQLPVIPIALGLYLYLLGSPQSRLVYVVGGATAVAVGLFVLVATPFIVGIDLFQFVGGSDPQSNIAAGVSGISSGLEDRLGLITDGWQDFRQQPFVGLGPHGMRASGLEKNVHNEYVAYLYERGLLGLSGLLLLHAVVVTLGLRSMQTGDRIHRFVMAGLLAAYCQVAINDLGHELLRQRDVWMLYVVVVSYASVELERVWVQHRAKLASRFPWIYPEPGSPTVASPEAAG